MWAFVVFARGEKEIPLVAAKRVHLILNFTVM